LILYQTYPRLKSYIQEQIDFARDNGFVQTIVPSLFKDINSQNAIVRGGAERNAVNAPIQEAAIIKIAMINIHQN
jgi:DNA polymerase-1